MSPKTRAECVNGPRPCPKGTCRYHLDVAPSCALDVADEGPQTLREVAVFFGLTRERVRQIERVALVKLHAALRSRGISAEVIEGLRDLP